MKDDEFADEAGGRAAMAASLEAQASAGSPPASRDEEAYVDPTGRIVRRGMPAIAQLPPDAPVTALGTFGNRLYFLDAHAQLRELAAKEVNRTMILHLFGDDTRWLYDLWPVFKKVSDGEFEVSNWEANKAQESLMRACSRRGIWRPQDHVRGRGAWVTDGGRLVVHSGKQLHFQDGSWERPGLVNGKVYPAGVRALEPATVEPDAIDGTEAADEILQLMRTWRWKRSFDPFLLFGFVAAAMVAGALKVRPLAWVTGEKGTGKSSLVGEGGLIHRIFGDGILMTANTTAAGLYQKLMFDSLPVAIDEIEAKRGSQKTEAVVELARQAYSGGMVLRGGADHEGKEFRAMCPVLFGSILIPSLMPQDLSRLALLCLEPFDQDAKEPDFSSMPLNDWGRAMLRRWLMCWDEWPERLGAWHTYLRNMGHSGRSADQFGTLLAAADLMLHEDPPDEDRMDALAGAMQPTELAETQVESSNAERCIDYAMSRPLHSMRGGEQMMVSELIMCAVRRYGGSMENPVKPMDAVRYLERAGITVLCHTIERGAAVLKKPSKMAPGELSRLLDSELPWPEGVHVAFAPSGDGILELFRGSDWEGVPGAHNPYAQALERVTDAARAFTSVRIGGRTYRPVMIPIRNCIDVPTKQESEASDG